jgi:peptide/nickel transport system substrate-binding protein
LNYTPDLTPIPQLATAWSVSDDGLRYTFTLRKGVKWHDGRDFTSADVAYSIREVVPVSALWPTSRRQICIRLC